MLFLPSANDIIRDIACGRFKHYGYDKEKQLNNDVLKGMSNHIEEEIKHIKKRNEIKR
jgi:Ca2+-binding EF-hand superfamily protein